jgi:GntR family transcriptional regulator
VTTRFLRAQFEPADREVARALGVRPRQRVFALERLRLVAGRPTSFQASYLAAALGEDVAKADLRVTPLRQVLSFKLGIEITSARETVSAVPLAARAAARELGCRVGAPAFQSDRTSFAADGTPIVYDRVFIPGDRFRITRDLHYDQINDSECPEEIES